jgi:hypothetical protein
MRVTPMLHPVAKHVNQRVPRGAWRRQRACVPTISPEPTPSEGQAVDALCNTDLQPPHTSDESSGVVCFHDEVDVVVLHGEVNDPTHRAAPRRGLCNGRSNSGKNVLAAQRPKGRAQRNVHRVTPTMHWSRCMRHLPSPIPQLSSRTGPPAAPRWREQYLELFWNSPHHSIRLTCDP